MFKLLSFNTFNLDILKCYEKNYKNGKNEVTIYDCLNLYNEPTICKLRCENCNNRFQKIYTKRKIYSFAETIIFLIDRGTNFDPANNLMNILFKIEENIDLSSFIIDQNSIKKFELIGIVSIHQKLKKYVSFYKSFIDKDWYCCKDEQVDFITFPMIKKYHNENNSCIPCILFYRIINQKMINKI
jgi:hypothetical protein